MVGLRQRNCERRADPRRGVAERFSAIRRALALLCTLGWIVACAASEDGAEIDAALPTPPVDTTVNPSTTPDTGTARPVDAADPATAMDTGTGTATPVPAADASTPSPTADASTPDATSDAGTADAGDAGPAPGKLPLADPNMPGPYEVTKLENVGVGFENPPTSANDRGDGAGCTSFIQIFGETAEAAREYALFGETYKVELYTLYYPKNMVDGQLYPIISWANGTCAKTPGYDALLTHVASQGFIVIATNSRYTGSGKFQLRGVDYILAENARAESPLFNRVEVANVGLFGHSQGGGSTGAASADPRIKSSVLMHGGSGSMLHAPAFFLTGEMDNPTGVRSAYDGARVPAAFGNLKMSNHITMMKEPMRMAPEVAAWFRYTMLDDTLAKAWFVGPDCLLCKDPEWVYAQKELK